MKKTILISLLAATLAGSSFASGFVASPAPNLVTQIDETTLEELIALNRVSVGMDRATVTEQLGAPRAKLNANVWVFSGFRASNVYGGEMYDTLIVVFKADRVDAIRLTNQEQIRVATARSAVATQNVAKW